MAMVYAALDCPVGYEVEREDESAFLRSVSGYGQL